jgi:2-polyprenyl-3-methyl-5-hydroxy-6-metoxy-1,4-benzoquinol methylase
VRCYKNKKGFYEIKPRPSISELKSYYSSKYFQEGRGSYEVRYDKRELKWIVQKSKFKLFLANKFLSSKKNKSLSVLDVGCGEGFCMDAFLKNGWKVEGIDFSNEGLKQKNPHLIRFLEKGDIELEIEKKIKDNKTYDCVLLLNVLEHVLKPIDLLKKLRKLIKKKGVLLITVPNDFSKAQKMAQKLKLINHSFWVAPPDHLQYFDNISLARLAKHCGWKDISSVAGFPIDWFLFNPSSNYIKYKRKGKQAHTARIILESLIFECDFESVFRFGQALARLGMGRDITAIFRLSGRITDKH